MKKTLRIRRHLITTQEGKFFVDPLSNFGYGLSSKGGYEPDMVDTVKQILKNGDVFLDVGANEGYFSVIASKSVGQSGKVICIEPQSRLQSVLFRNIQENNSYNINVMQRAISDRIGIANLSLTPDMNTGASGLFPSTKYQIPTEIVPQTTLSELYVFLRLKNNVKLMKIDVEGFEHEAVLGSKELFEKGIIENIALELHPSILKQRGKSEKDIINFLQTNGYKKNNRYNTLVMTRISC